MKVLHVIPSITVASGGPAATMSNMVEIWLLEDIESDVLTIRHDSATYSVKTNINEVEPSFPERYSNSREGLKWFQMHADNYDLVIFHAIWSCINLVLAAYARYIGKRYIVIPHGSLDPFDLQKKAWLKRLLGPLLIKPYLNGAKAIVCSTQQEADLLVCYGSRVPRKVIPWPVKPDVSSCDRALVRKRLRVAPDEFVVLFLGRVDYKKGFAVLLPAFQQLLRSGIKAKLLIVGPETRGYAKVVTKMIVALDLVDRVEILRPVVGHAKSEMFQAADCFVLPSLNENFAIAVVEAMQHSLPVVISRNVYIHPVITASGAGIVCDYDAQETANALIRVARDPAERKKMAGAARVAGLTYSPDNLKLLYAKTVTQLIDE